MTIDKIRRTTEYVDEATELAIDLDAESLPREATPCGKPAHVPQRREPMTAQWRKIGAEGTEGSGERHMQAMCRARGFRVECGERAGLFTIECGSDHHDRNGIDAPACDQCANRLVHARRKAVVVRAKPDSPRCFSHRPLLGRALGTRIGRRLDVLLG